MALIDDFAERFPEFSQAVVDQYIPILEDVWPCYYGRAYEGCNKEIILNLIAHLVTMETSAGSSASRNVASKSVGSVSVSYEANRSNSELVDFFGATKYGQRFMLLTRRFIGPKFV